MSEKKIRFLKGLSTGLVVAAIVFAFLIAGIRIFGVQVYGVLTGSMEPAYPTGSLIYVKDVDASELRVNDVITFSVSPGVIATHRIVEIVPDENNPSILRYRTKGDANREVDAALVGANNIIGRAMFAIPQLGYLASYIQQSPGIYVAILVCGLMIAFVFYTDSLDSKQKQQDQVQQEEKPAFGLVTAVNKLSQKVLGKDLIKAKEPPLTPGYTPPQAMQQPMQQPMQQYPQGYYPQQYPMQYGQMQPGQMQPGQQGYPQQGYPQYNGMPQYPQQGQWQQNYPQQGYYPQQMQQPAQQAQPYYYPQGYPQQYGQQMYQQPQQQGYPVPQARSNPPQRGYSDQDK